LTLNHGKFVTHRTRDVWEPLDAVELWRPHLAVVNIDAVGISSCGASQPGHPIRARIPVLAVTRHQDVETQPEAFDLGIDNITTLPLSPEELLARGAV
jgi:DNA-binding response OmpR family regulator